MLRVSYDISLTIAQSHVPCLSFRMDQSLRDHHFWRQPAPNKMAALWYLHRQQQFEQYYNETTKPAQWWAWYGQPSFVLCPITAIKTNIYLTVCNEWSVNAAWSKSVMSNAINLFTSKVIAKPEFHKTPRSLAHVTTQYLCRRRRSRRRDSLTSLCVRHSCNYKAMLMLTCASLGLLMCETPTFSMTLSCCCCCCEVL